MMAFIHDLKYDWDNLNRRDKTSIITTQIMKQILINGNNVRVGLKEINVNIGIHKPNLRIDVLEINKKKNILVGYEVKSCIQDFRTDKKWQQYLDLINQLYFVFDSETFSKHLDEISKKIGDKAGIYVYNPHTRWLSLIKGVKFTELPLKDEVFYRNILFNYLLRNGVKALQRLTKDGE